MFNKIPDFKWKGAQNLILIPTPTIYDFKKVFNIVEPYILSLCKGYDTAENVIARGHYNPGMHIMVQKGGLVYYVTKGDVMYTAYAPRLLVDLEEFYKTYDSDYIENITHLNIALDILEKKLKL